MSAKVNQWLRNTWQRVSGRLHRPQQGQSLVIVILALIGILAFVGLSIDLGLVYVERVRVGRAADAAALAAVAELPLESAAHERAQAYLAENGYDANAVGHVRLVINSRPDEEGGPDFVSGPAEADADTIIWIDTAFSREPPLMSVNTASRIRVRIKRWVPMTFLQLIGFSRIPVEGLAEAENINTLDVVIVYDKSGSMEYDTLCYGCWDPPGWDVYGTTWDCPSADNPDGCLYPLKWSQTYTTVVAGQSPDLCRTGHTYTGPSGYTFKDEWYKNNSSGKYYIIIEGEEYSSYDMRADYHTWQYTPYRTFWVIQRNGYNVDDGGISVGSLGRDTRGGYLSHHPWPSYQSTTGFGVGCTWSAAHDPGTALNPGPFCKAGLPGGPFPIPRVDYKFTVPAGAGGNYYFWLRGQDGYQDNIFWGVDSQYPQGQETNFTSGMGATWDGARSDRWGWRRLSLGETGGGGDAVNLAAGTQHTLSLWAGGAGFDVDRIVITTDSNSSLPSAMLTASPNNARTDWACDPCDPRFAGLPGGLRVDVDPGAGTEWWYLPDCHVGPTPEKQDKRNDAIYSGEMPIRQALKSAINFIDRMDFNLDQIGYVRYDTSASTRSELECLRRLGPENLENPLCNPAQSPYDPDCGCRQPPVIDAEVIAELNTTYSSGSTNIAGGIKNGIAVLSTGTTHYGRPGAAHIMVLMTDGEANQTGGCDPECDDDDYWPGPDGGAAKDCVIYYALQARNNGIVIYTISLGYSADLELMQAVADTTGGEHRWAPSPDKLDDIFDELFERIFLRLID
jgi:hypothetical protein